MVNLALMAVSLVGAILSLSWVLCLLFVVRPRMNAQRDLWDAQLRAMGIEPPR